MNYIQLITGIIIKYKKEHRYTHIDGTIDLLEASIEGIYYSYFTIQPNRVVVEWESPIVEETKTVLIGQ